MFHFTIRDVLWLTVVVALACAWGIDRSRLTARNRSTFEAMLDWKDDANSYLGDAAVAEARLDVMARKMRVHGWTVEFDWEKLKPGEDSIKPPAQSGAEQ